MRPFMGPSGGEAIPRKNALSPCSGKSPRRNQNAACAHAQTGATRVGRAQGSSEKDRWEMRDALSDDYGARCLFVALPNGARVLPIDCQAVCAYSRHPRMRLDTGVSSLWPTACIDRLAYRKSEGSWKKSACKNYRESPAVIFSRSFSRRENYFLCCAAKWLLRSAERRGQRPSKIFRS